jgi:hypothetical protein
MIGGELYQNWDAGAVINLQHGNAVLINVYLHDNLEHAVYSNASGVLVNVTAVNNRGDWTDSRYTIRGAAKLYNCVVIRNTAGANDNVNVDDGAYGAGTNPATTPGTTSPPYNRADIYNTVAPGYFNPGAGELVSEGTSGKPEYYPLNPDGSWNTTPSSATDNPAYGPITTAVTDPAVLEEIRLALSKDAAGKSRFNGSAIGIGAVQQ